MFPCASLATLETAPKYGVERTQLLMTRWSCRLGRRCKQSRTNRPPRRRDRPTRSKRAARAAVTASKPVPASGPVGHGGTGGGLDEIDPVAIVEREASGGGEHGRYRVDGTAKRDFAEPIVPGAGDVDVTDGTHGPASGAFRVSVAAAIDRKSVVAGK